jgi:N-hydroxyarylamine O-acetyltransferase
MNIEKYLRRIDYQGELTPSLSTLQGLQETHLLHVPFENLDIALRRKIVLDITKIYRKIVIRKRGGFCYELNGLFHWLLQELGFTCGLISARVYDEDRKDYGPEFDHQAILVTIEGKEWISDVGFGDFSIHPLPLKINILLNDPNGQFLIEKNQNKSFRISRFRYKQNSFIPEYLFSTSIRQLLDFDQMCHYHQTSPESHFTRKKVCSLATMHGRITLTENELVITKKERRKKFTIKDDQEFDLALKKYFNLKL